MTAMTDKVETAMHANLNTLFERMAALIPFDMSHDEALELIAPPEHHHMLREVSKIADVKSSENWFTLRVPASIDGANSESVQLQLRTFEQVEPPLLPRDPQWHPHKVGGEKVLAWMRQRYVLGRRFGLAQHVLMRLNKLCDSGQQLRVIWPAVMFLCEFKDDTPQLAKWAERFGQFKRCASLPALSPQLKEAVRDTAAILTQAALLGKEQKASHGQVLIYPSVMQSFEFEGRSLYRM